MKKRVKAVVILCCIFIIFLNVAKPFTDKKDDVIRVCCRDILNIEKVTFYIQNNTLPF